MGPSQPVVRRRRCIGLLGGSFNPAHEGHRHISLQALDLLGLDEIWWLVSPQNPLKPSAGMAAPDARLATAKRVAHHPRIRVSDIERDLNTRYTIDTLRALKRRYRDCVFVWLIGADNLIQIPRWKSWEDIFHLAAIAVFARPSYCFRALAGMAATRFDRYRQPEWTAKALVWRRPPAWVFLRIKLHPASSTSIRENRGG